MIPTQQLYPFASQQELDVALLALSNFASEQYAVLSTDDLTLHVWFADVDTVLIPFCNSAFSQPSE